MPSSTTAYLNLDINSHSFPMHALSFSWWWLHIVSTWNCQHSFFLLSWTTSSSSPPVPRTCLHPCLHPDLHAASMEEMRLLLFVTPPPTCALHPSLNSQDVCTRITDFLFHVVFFSLSTRQFLSICYYSFWNPTVPPVTAEFLSTPCHSPNSSMLWSSFLCFLTIGSLPILSPNSSIIKFLSLPPHQKCS